jgi:hypothetical protein
VSGQYKKEKKEILDMLDVLGRKAEMCALDRHEREYK